jgi:hypothetical protein
LKKKSSETGDLTDFYSKLLVTNEVFNIIQEGNLRILNEQSKIMKQEELSADVEYLLNFVNNHKDLVLEIIKEMDNYAFKNLPSLNEKNFISFGGDISRYFILQDEIKLYPHTLNVAIQMADMLSESEHPNNIIEIGTFLNYHWIVVIINSLIYSLYNIIINCCYCTATTIIWFEIWNC